MKLVKAHRNTKLGKRAEETQDKQMGQGRPKENKKDTRAHK